MRLVAQQRKHEFFHTCCLACGKRSMRLGFSTFGPVVGNIKELMLLSFSINLFFHYKVLRYL